MDMSACPKIGDPVRNVKTGEIRYFDYDSDMTREWWNHSWKCRRFIWEIVDPDEYPYTPPMFKEEF